MTSKATLKLALQILAGYRLQFAEYAEFVAESHKAGFSPSHCMHGVNLWTDYDPMCGACEDGLNYWDYETFAGMALAEAKKAYQEYQKRIDAVTKLSSLGAPQEVVSNLLGWVSDPITQYGK